MLKNLKQSKNMLGAVMVLALFVVWMASGLLTNSKTTPQEDIQATPQAIPAASVATQVFTPQNYVRHLNLPAQTAARYRAQIAPQTSGRIASIVVENGTQVTQGQTLATLDKAERAVELASAQASLAAARKLATSARTLAKDGYMSQTTLAEREAAEAEAQSRVKNIQQDLAYTTLTAPINGVVENRTASVGDVASIAAPLMDVVNRTDLLLTAQIPQKERNLVKMGQTISATLITGEEVAGVVDFIATNANPQSRTYEVTMAVDGTKYPMPTGMSANVNIPTTSQMAYQIPHSAVVLGADGTLGAMQLVGNTAKFTPLTILQDTPEYLWVTGLPEGKATLMTRGQLSVKDGAQVQAE